MSHLSRKTGWFFGAAAAAGLGWAAFSGLQNGGNTPPTPTNSASFAAGPICTAKRQDVQSILASLRPAPVMSLEMAQKLAADHSGPAPAPVLTQDPDTPDIYMLRWLNAAGKSDRSGAPAALVFNARTRRVTMEAWAKDGELNSENDQPATTEWDDKGRVKIQTWRERGLMQRKPGPAFREYDWDHDRFYETWYWQDKVFRDEALPARMISVLSSGLTIKEVWGNRTAHDRLEHRKDGLQISEHDPDTGFETRRRYLFHNHEAHTAEFAYEIRKDAKTGGMRQEEWTENDRPVGIVKYDGEGHLISQYPGGERIKALRLKVETMQKSGGMHEHHHHESAPAPSGPQ